MKFRSCPNKCPQSFIIIDWFQSRCKNNNLYTKAAVNHFFIKSKNIQTSLLILIYINRWKSKKMQNYSIWLIMLFCHYIITNTVHASFKFQQSISNLIFFTTMMMAIKCLKSAFNACTSFTASVLMVPELFLMWELLLVKLFSAKSFKSLYFWN